MHIPPKRFLFATTGSLGDVHPFLAVGIELKRRGHEVTIATALRHAAVVRIAGLEFRHMRPDPLEDDVFHARFMHSRRGAAFVFREYLAPAMAQSYADLLAAAEEADVLVSQSLALAMPSVAEITGIPWYSAVFQPMTLFSAYDPPVIPWLPFRRGRVAFNQWLMTLMRRHTGGWTQQIRDFRRSLGLADGGDALYDGQHSPQGSLAMFSPLFGMSQADWPTAMIQTGWARFQPPETSMPDGLMEFLNAGPPPIVFTLGSASSLDARDFFEVSLAAARRTGNRALLLTGKQPAIAPSRLGRDAAAFTFAPYAEVFSKARAVVHAGGIGAIGSGILAGVPQLLVPFAHDQHDNAARAARLGVARVMPRRAYRPGRAARELTRLLQGKNEVVLQRCASALRQEDGTRHAADRLERWAGQEKERRCG